MKKPVKIILGVATLWPLLYMGFFFVSFFLPFFAFGPGLPASFEVLFLLHCFTILWTLVLLIIYIVNVFTNDRVEKDTKALWAVVVFMGNVIAMPVYWYLYIWRQPKGTIEDTPRDKM